jgi:phage/plasmid-like protein (TIGR03299 family)
MAHKLSIQNGIAEVVCGSNQTPWHNLGTVVAGLMTAKEALEKARLAWEVAGMPVTVNGNVLPFPNADKRGETWQGITRQDTGACLGIMRGQYECIQNAQAFQFFDNLIGQGEAVYDTAGALRGGKQVWLLAKIDGIKKINGDDHKTYGLMITSHDGSYALQVQYVVERVVCANTLSIALSGATNTCKVRHTRNWKNGEAEAARVLNLGEHYFKQVQISLEGMNEQMLNPDQMAEFTNLLLPARNGDDDKASTRTKNIRSEIAGLFERGAGNLGKSRWDAFQAVSDYADHNMTIRGENSTRLESSLQGAAATMKQNAYDILTNEDIMGNLMARKFRPVPVGKIEPTADFGIEPHNPFLALLNNKN